jgi:hypothetical protein
MDTNPQSTTTFFHPEEGPFFKALVMMSLQDSRAKLALGLIGVTWLPLFIINAINGTLWSGTSLPFLKDIAIQVQLLLALPMLILIKPSIYNKANEIINYFTETLLSPIDRQQRISSTFHVAKKWMNSIWPQIILLLIVIGAAINNDHHRVFPILESETSSWMLSGKSGIQSMSFAGSWAVYFSKPVFQFLFLRWLWRYIIWVYLLYRFSRMNLKLLPLHADHAGGLGITFMAQRYFALIFVASGMVVSGRLMDQVYEHPENFNVLKNEVIGYVVFCVILIVLPLLFFSGKLLKTKHQGLVKQSHLAADLSGQFARDWVNDLSLEERLKNRKVDPQMVNAHSDLFSLLQELRVIPVTVLDLLGLSLLLLLPFLPILFIYFSTMELLQKIIGLLF